MNLSAKRHVPTMHERMSKSKMALLAVASILYGFFFGIMLAHYWQLGEAALYAVFGLVSAGMLVALSLVKGRVDLTQVIRVCAIAIAVLLTVCALVYEFTTVPLSLVEAAAWAIAIFFTIVVFADSEFLQPGSAVASNGVSLCLATVGLIVARLVLSLYSSVTMANIALPVATLGLFLLLLTVFLPDSRSWVREWGFSSFISPEPKEEFYLRRCGELTAQFALTPREFEILRLLVAGGDKNTISEHLVISPQTAKTHVRNIYTKLQVHSRDELMSLIEREG